MQLFSLSGFHICLSYSEMRVDARRQEMPSSQGDNQRQMLDPVPRPLNDTSYVRTKVGDAAGSAILLAAFQRDSVSSSPQVCSQVNVNGVKNCRLLSVSVIGCQLNADYCH